jgi:DHA1 family tetracycline resistance protein-like MFS transporter
LPVERRRKFEWSRANPLSSLRQLAALKGVGALVGVLAFAGLAQFSLYTVWVLYGSFRFGWGPTENGWSLFAVGVVSAVVQGALLGRLLKRFTPQRLAVAGLVSSVLAFTAWGLATEPWMMYAVIFANVLGSAVAASLQGLVSSAADEKTQGQTMGAVSSLNSLMAVVAPVFAAPVMAAIAHLPRNDWRVGAPMFLCAALQAAALVMAMVHFRRMARRRAAAVSTPPVTAAR